MKLQYCIAAPVERGGHSFTTTDYSCYVVLEGVWSKSVGDVGAKAAACILTLEAKCRYFTRKRLLGKSSAHPVPRCQVFFNTLNCKTQSTCTAHTIALNMQ